MTLLSNGFQGYYDRMKKAVLTQLIKRSFIEMMKDVGTSIPGHITAFDESTQRAQVQIGVVRRLVNGQTFEPTPVVEVPVYFPGGDYCMETEINPGNEGVILFSQRCIDAWVQTGGVAEVPVMRFHDFSDAIFMPGIRSQPNVLSDFKNDGIRLRNKAGDKYVWLKGDGSVEINASSVNIVTTEPDGLTHNGINVGGTHVHVSAAPGVDTTPPKPTPP